MNECNKGSLALRFVIISDAFGRCGVNLQLALSTILSAIIKLRTELTAKFLADVLLIPPTFE